ncbi:MAG: hypothetical protein ABI863_09795 [Ginsengibacter sp.]
MSIFTRIPLITGLFISHCSILKAQQVPDTSAHHLLADSTMSDSLYKTVDSAQAVVAMYPADSVLVIKKKSYLMAGLSYMNNNVYLGRKDSARLPYLTFTLGYYFKSGFFIDGSLNYLASSDSRIDGVNFDAGYSFTAGKYSGEAAFSKYFYSSQSTNVKSAVKSSLSYFNSYDFGFITPTFTAFLNFGDKTDFGGILGLEHTFYALDDKLDVTPTFTANASTQNYYNNYYKTRRYTIKRKNKAPVTGVANVTGIVEDASHLKVLDYEASLPIDYTAGRFIFSANPVYAFPVNPSIVQVTTTKANNTSTTRTNTEKIKNTFFITVGVTYKFKK